MSKLPLFLFLIGSLFIFIGISGSKTQVQTIKEVKSLKQIQTPIPSSTAQNIQSTPQEAVVTRVIDGDTIDVEINNKEEKVRLIGINAPEKNECFGKEATERAIELLSSKSVGLETDPTQDDRDKYHRLLRYVFVQGLNFDELMIKEGFAKEYTYHTPYKYQSEFKSAEKEAKENKRGLWVVCK